MENETVYDPPPTPAQLQDEAAFLEAVPEGAQVYYYDKRGQALSTNNHAFYALLDRAEVIVSRSEAEAPLTITKDDGSGPKEITREQFFKERGGVKAFCIHTDGYHISAAEIKTWPTWMQQLVKSAGQKSFTVSGTDAQVDRFVDQFNALERQRNNRR